MFATSSPAVLIFCSLWCLVLPCVAVPSLVSNQERHKAAKLPDYKYAERINPHQYCLGQVDHFVHSWKLKKYRKRQFQVGQIRSGGTVFQSLLLLLLYAGLCVVCNVGAVVGLGVDCITASEQFDQFGSAFFPAKRLVLLFTITCILSLQLWTMRAFNTRSGGKVSNRNCRKKCSQRAGILPFTNCFCMHELLLILSGDVELNPGPQGHKKTPDTTGQFPGQFPQHPVAVMETSEPQEESPQSENIAIKPTSVEFPSTIPTIPEDMNTALPDLESPLGELHLEKRSVEDMKEHERKFAPVMSQKPPTIDPGDVVKQKLHNQKHFNQQHHLSQIVHDDSLPVDGNYPVNQDTLGANAMSADNVVEHCTNNMKQIWSNRSGFKPRGFKEKDREKLFNILRAANQHFRKNESYPLCIRCGREKPKKGNKVVNISHVFPESMLIVYQAVHCGNQRPFIYDVSKFTQEAGFSREASEYGYPLQCFDCEHLYGDAECNLKDVYMLLIAKKDDLKVNQVSKKVKEKLEKLEKKKNAARNPLIKEMWLLYALVNVMYRGILVSASINTILNSYEEKFIKLWDNALGNGTTTQVRLYVIPLHPFLTNDVHFMNILERLLRNPTPTELHKSNVAGEFLYTNFDCFHLVLPLCTKSEEYFDRYISANVTGNEVFLRRCQYKTRFTHDSITYYYPKDTSICFPPVLHEVCIVKLREWVQRLSIRVEIGDPPEPFSLNQYVDLSKQSWIFADIHPEIKQEPLHFLLQEQQAPNGYVCYSSYGQDNNDKPREYTKLKVLKKYDKLIDDAIELSILNKLCQFVERYKKLTSELEQAEKELKKVKEYLNKKLENITSEFLKRIEELNLENKELKKEASKLEQLLFTNKRTERAFKLLTNTEAERKQIIIREQTTKIQQLEEENKQLREKNKELKAENNYATNKDAKNLQIITEQIEQIRILTEDNKRLKEKLGLQSD